MTFRLNQPPVPGLLTDISTDEIVHIREPLDVQSSNLSATAIIKGNRPLCGSKWVVAMHVMTSFKKSLPGMHAAAFGM